MKKRALEPSDAPLGPIVRYIRRWSIGDGFTTGGAFGFTAPSPRLRGWLEVAGFDLADLSRKIDAATSWAVATPTELKREAAKRDREARRSKMAALVPLFRALYESKNDNPGRETRKRWLCREAATYLAGEWGNEDAEDSASVIVESGVMGEAPPTFRTIETWFQGASLSEMLRAGDGDWEMPDDLPPTPKKKRHDPVGNWMLEGDRGHKKEHGE